VQLGLGVYDEETHLAYAFYPDSTPGNHPPDTPSVPSGPDSGQAGVSYGFSSSATDPEGDSVALRFSWVTATRQHGRSCGQWCFGFDVTCLEHAGSYTVKAQAEDVHNATSAGQADIR